MKQTLGATDHLHRWELLTSIRHTIVHICIDLDCLAVMKTTIDKETFKPSITISERRAKSMRHVMTTIEEYTDKQGKHYWVWFAYSDGEEVKSSEKIWFLSECAKQLAEYLSAYSI